MGTSSSSTGPGMGVSLVPPWVPELPAPPEDGLEKEPNDNLSSTAPASRFGLARRSFGHFARGGASSNLRRGLGYYVQKGHGGAYTAAKRMGGTVWTAGVLYSMLAPSFGGQSDRLNGLSDFPDLSDRTADEIMDTLVEVIRPIDGSLDSEASRQAIQDSLSDLLDRFPDADLLALSEEQSVFAVERYLALDVYNHFRRDIGKTLHEKAPSPRDVLSRLKDVKDYIAETVSAQFRALRNLGQRLTRRKVVNLARQSLFQTFEVFEEYVK